VPRSFVIIGTSGSHDYLKDPTGDRRYWPVRVSSSTGPEVAELAEGTQLSPEERTLLNDLIVSRPWVHDPKPIVVDEGGLCDGLHDEGSPEHYLCSRCYPDLWGDLVEAKDDESDEATRHESEEIE
jgi:hypothetical protein